MIKSKKLSKIKIIKHGFFNKTGGKSKKIYKSLNCGPGSKDNPSDVKKNLEIVKKKIKSTAESIFLLHQIHSNKFVYINKKNKFRSKPKADAVITNQKKFLTSMGILQRAEIISKNIAFSKKADLFYRVRRLIDDKEMGELFKVMLIKNKKNNFRTGFQN